MRTLELNDTKSFKKFNHQSKATNNTLEYFNDPSNTRGKIIMPCGSGKSLTSFWIMELLKSSNNKMNRTIITVPNLILQAQIFKTFYSGLSETHKFICIGSDQDVAVEDDVAVTTSPYEIKSFLATFEEPVIIIATYQSLDKIAEICKEIDYSFDFAIIDEAHRTVGSKEKCFSTILFNNQIKIKKRLFMTATEKVYSGKDDTVIGMENADFYGKTIFEYTLPQAIKDGILCDYQIATIYSTSEEINEFINSNKYLDQEELGLSDDEYKNMMCSVLATIRAIKEKGCKKIVSYHSTIKKAKIFKALLDSSNLLGIETFHINGKQSSKEKNENINSFKEASIAVLTNSQALVEGVDIPCIDCIVFADKRDSAIGVIQAVGRSLRKFKGKTESYIVLPILTETEEDIDIENSVFYQLFSILISLSIMDERLLLEMKSINIGGTVSETKILKNIINVDNKFKDKITELVGKINLKVWDKLTKQPFLSYEECKKWVQTNENIKSISEWNSVKHKLPSFIPKAPNHVYKKNNEWNGWGNFLGTGNTKKWDFLPYDEFKKWIKESDITKNIKVREQWLKITQLLPSFIPKSPARSYKEEFEGWGTILRTGNTYKGDFYDYNKAKAWIQTNELTKNVKTRDQWNEEVRQLHLLPPFIPKDPYGHYKRVGSWNGWGDFLGTGNTNRGDFLPYDGFKKWVKESDVTKNIKTTYEWRQITHLLPSFIPKNPAGYYKEGFEGWGTILRTGSLSNKDRVFLPYDEFKNWVEKDDITKNIKTSTQWNKITHLLPSFIPKNPAPHYKKEWNGWGVILGTGNIRFKDFYDYDKAKAWVQTNELTKNVKTMYEWSKITHLLPPFIPKSPYNYYKAVGTFKGMGDFLGTGSLSNKDRVFYEYKEAKEWVQQSELTNNIKKQREWNKITHLLPSFIPKSPSKYYKNNGNWKGWNDFFRTKKIN